MTNVIFRGSPGAFTISSYLLVLRGGHHRDHLTKTTIRYDCGATKCACLTNSSLINSSYSYFMRNTADLYAPLGSYKSAELALRAMEPAVPGSGVAWDGFEDPLAGEALEVVCAQCVLSAGWLWLMDSGPSALGCGCLKTDADGDNRTGWFTLVHLRAHRRRHPAVLERMRRSLLESSNSYPRIRSRPSPRVARHARNSNRLCLSGEERDGEGGRESLPWRDRARRITRGINVRSGTEGQPPLAFPSCRGASRGGPRRQSSAAQCP